MLKVFVKTFLFVLLIIIWRTAKNYKPRILTDCERKLDSGPLYDSYLHHSTSQQATPMFSPKPVPLKWDRKTTKLRHCIVKTTNTEKGVVITHSPVSRSKSIAFSCPLKASYGARTAKRHFAETNDTFLCLNLNISSTEQTMHVPLSI